VKSLLAGLGLTAAVTLALRAVFGPGVVLAGLAFGLLATVIQLAAVRLLRRAWSGSNVEFLKGVGAGMGLRFAGVVGLLVAILLDRERFPPLPSAVGFLGVLIPLLFLEVRLAR
jgi:hypothetical protein